MIYRIIGVVALILCLCLACSDDPLKSEPQQPEGYAVYFHPKSNPGQWYAYYPESDFLDTLSLPTTWGSWAALSPTGDRLYLAAFTGQSLAIVDMESRTLIHDFSWPIYSAALSPDGSLLAVDHGGFDLITTQGLSSQYHSDTSQLHNLSFSWNGEQLLGHHDYIFASASVSDPGNPVEENISVGTIMALQSRILTTQLNNNWYVMSLPSNFVAWDRSDDTALFTDSITFGSVLIQNAISPDGKYVAYLNSKVDGTQYSELRIYDVVENRLVNTTEAIVPGQSGDTTLLHVTQLAFTPDSKWLIGVSSTNGDYVMLFNMEEMKTERYIEIPANDGIVDVVCQTGL